MKFELYSPPFPNMMNGLNMRVVSEFTLPYGSLSPASDFHNRRYLCTCFSCQRARVRVNALTVGLVWALLGSFFLSEIIAEAVSSCLPEKKL